MMNISESVVLKSLLNKHFVPRHQYGESVVLKSLLNKHFVPRHQYGESVVLKSLLSCSLIMLLSQIKGKPGNNP